MRLLASLILKLLELGAENEKLKQEISSRRSQADRWRKRYQAQQRGISELCVELRRGRVNSKAEAELLADYERRQRLIKEKT